MPEVANLHSSDQVYALLNGTAGDPHGFLGMHPLATATEPAKGRRKKAKARIANYEALVAQEANVKLDQVQIHIPAGPRLGDLILLDIDDGSAPYPSEVEPTALLAVLTSRERTVIAEVFGLVRGTPSTVGEVAKAHRVSAEKVTQLVEVALTKLRKHLSKQECAA